MATRVKPPEKTPRANSPRALVPMPDDPAVFDEEAFCIGLLRSASTAGETLRFLRQFATFTKEQRAACAYFMWNELRLDESKIARVLGFKSFTDVRRLLSAHFRGFARSGNPQLRFGARLARMESFMMGAASDRRFGTAARILKDIIVMEMRQGDYEAALRPAAEREAAEAAAATGAKLDILKLAQHAVEQVAKSPRPAVTEEEAALPIHLRDGLGAMTPPPDAPALRPRDEPAAADEVEEETHVEHAGGDDGGAAAAADDPDGAGAAGGEQRHS